MGVLAPSVRRYFTARKSLPNQYWTGMERNGSFSLYAFPDLSYLSQVASNEPYAHWWAVTPPSAETDPFTVPPPRRRLYQARPLGS